MAFTSVNESNLDFDNLYVTDAWMVDKFVGYKLFGWGYDAYGQLGDSAFAQQNTPVSIGSLTNWKQMGGDFRTTHGIKSDGTLWGWGENSGGQVGDNTTVLKSSPVQIAGGGVWSFVSHGGRNHSVALRTDGTLWGWGQNGAGQFGDGTITTRSAPVQIGQLTTWIQADAGGGHSAMINLTGQLWVCGYNNSGQLGDGTGGGTNGWKSSPVQVGSLTNWKQVSCGYRFTAAVKTDGTLWTWGANDYGQLGNNGSGTGANYRSSPVQVAGTNWKYVSAGWYQVLALKNDGSLWGWGKNDQGALGDGTLTNRSSPVQIGSLTNWKQISCGYQHAVATKPDGTLWAWGRNAVGQVGNPVQSFYSSPIQIGTLTNWKYANACTHHTHAVNFGD